MNPIPLPWLGAGALGIAVLSFGAGWQVNDWRRDAKALEAKEQAHKQQREDQAKADDTAIEYEEGKADAEQRYTDRAAQVRIIYRDREVPAVCEPDADSKRLLDQAIAEANQPTGQPQG